MKPPVTITYTLSENAYMRGCYQLWAHRALGRTGNFVVGGVLIFCALFLMWQGVPGPWSWIMLLGGAGIIGMDVMRDRAWRRHYRGLIKYTAPIRVAFADGGLDMQSAEASTHLDWSTFRHHIFTQDFLFLVIDQRRFSVIPLAAFDSHADRAAAEAIVAANLKPLKGRLL
ncbi:YcxB family protein [Yoonia sp. 208BN28-4]|uniref:YcxB family protein n=1 Tax=Yoonia sp. 208BN28-4 TaxID=3126505 RepID=UPI0030ADA0DB